MSSIKANLFKEQLSTIPGNDYLHGGMSAMYCSVGCLVKRIETNTQNVTFKYELPHTSQQGLLQLQHNTSAHLTSPPVSLWSVEGWLMVMTSACEGGSRYAYVTSVMFMRV